MKDGCPMRLHGMIDHLLNDANVSQSCTPPIPVKEATRRVFTAIMKKPADSIPWSVIHEQLDDLQTGRCAEGGITRLYQLATSICPTMAEDPDQNHQHHQHHEHHEHHEHHQDHQDHQNQHCPSEAPLVPSTPHAVNPDQRMLPTMTGRSSCYQHRPSVFRQHRPGLPPRPPRVRTLHTAPMDASRQTQRNQATTTTTMAMRGRRVEEVVVQEQGTPMSHLQPAQRVVLQQRRSLREPDGFFFRVGR